MGAVEVDLPRCVPTSSQKEFWLGGAHSSRTLRHEAREGIYVLLLGETLLGEVHYRQPILQARQEPLCLTVN